MSLRLRLGSRGSALALAQARSIAERLASAWPGIELPITVIATEGDRHKEIASAPAWGRGVFVKEIEEALAERRIDLAVHSLKDLPTDSPDDLVVAAVPARHDPRDALVSPRAAGIDDLPDAAIVATGSPRRRMQLLHRRRDLRFVDLRGNVDTRLRKLEEGACDALVLAVAGIERLGATAAPYHAIPTSLCLPAPGQGALALQVRRDDAEASRIVAALDDATASACVAAERAFLAALGAGCLAPAGALAGIDDGRLVLEGTIGLPDGSDVRRASVTGTPSEAPALGGALARLLLADGGEGLVERARVQRSGA